MNTSPMAERTRSLPIETWHALGLEGNVLPVKITLDGDSMRPLIRRGKDLVTIIPVNRPLKKGDIVLFKGGESRYVVHRVRKIRDNRVQTLGDNCVYPDPVMPLECIWGLVVKMERNGKAFRLDTKKSRLFGRFWMAVYPFRIICKKAKSLAARIVRKIIGRGKRK